MNTLLQRSFMDQRPIEIIYMTSESTCTKRKIIVKKIDGDVILAYCLLRKKFRKFRLYDILAAYPLLPYKKRTIS
jgi:predicted DNA-binding transcriptional regulator YafY